MQMDHLGLLFSFFSSLWINNAQQMLMMCTFFFFITKMRYVNDVYVGMFMCLYIFILHMPHIFQDVQQQQSCSPKILGLAMDPHQISQVGHMYSFPPFYNFYSI